MLKKSIFLICIVVAAAILMLAPAMGLVEQEEKSETVPETETTRETTVPPETLPPLPDSVLYYGEIRSIRQDTQGKPAALYMNSQRDGEYIMNLGESTAYIDSGERKNFDPAAMEVGQRYYVFHSPVQAMSLPPQSPAFAVVGNIPMDASCAMYHEVEKLEEVDEKLRITTENGTMILELDETSEIFSYEGQKLDASAVKEGDFIMAWYWNRGEKILRCSHIMVLPESENGEN